jgi:clan AA aspartic protease
MIKGAVNSRSEASIALTVQGAPGRRKTVNVVIDTGFDGWLTLPSGVISELQLDWRSRGSAQLADGNETIFDSYDAQILWDQQHRRIVIDSADVGPLAGMALLFGHRLIVDVQPDGDVTITALLSES